MYNIYSPPGYQPFALTPRVQTLYRGLIGRRLATLMRHQRQVCLEVATKSVEVGGGGDGGGDVVVGGGSGGGSGGSGDGSGDDKGDSGIMVMDGDDSESGWGENKRLREV